MTLTDALNGLLKLPEGSPVLTAGEWELDHFSPSSIDGFWKCPEQWRRERIGFDRMATTSKQIFGSVFHRAAEHNFAQKIDSHEDLPVEQVQERAGDAFNEVLDEEIGKREIVWGTDKPNEIQQECIRASASYHKNVAPPVQPIAVEHTFRVDLLGFPFTGRIDVVTEDRRIIDLKTTGRRKVQGDLDKDTQASGYLWARREEGFAAPDFSLHVAVRNKTPTQQTLSTTRTGGQLDQFEELTRVTLATVRHYLDVYGPDGTWPGASPLGWWCSQKNCSFWQSCCWRGGA